MPRSVDYKQAAVVYFEGDKADRIFVIQAGEVEILYHDMETNEDIRERLGPGEFFGVKSALGNYPRDDAATITKDSKVMVFTVQEFEAFCMSNTRIVHKMLKVFSKQLRNVNKKLTTMLKQKEADPDDGLYNIGELFIKQKKYDRALYAIRQYINEYPAGKSIVNAKKNLTLLERMDLANNGK